MKSYLLSRPITEIEVIRLDSLLAVDTSPKEVILFDFDPNVVTYDSLVMLGLDGNIARRWINYRKKGGQFRKPADVLKIYDMPSEWYQLVEGYIVVNIPELSEKLVVKPKPVDHQVTYSPVKSSNEFTIARFDINTADTSNLKSIYGIGSKLSARILKFRDRLGGFATADQLYEVYGLEPDVVQELLKYAYIQEDFEPEKIRVNHASVKELAAHPYLDYKVSRVIFNYREQHGSFTDQSELSAIHLVEDSLIVKVGPYLSFE